MVTVGIVGCGSIGSVLAHGFDKLKHQVVINDKDRERERELSFDSWPKPRMAEECDLVVFAVPTPTTEHGGDWSAVDAALTDFADGDATCLLRSTMPPGSTRRLAEKHELPLVYSPEFLRDRSNVEDFFHPDRIVLSGPERERAVVRDLLDTPEIDCDTVLEFDDYLTAEIGKEAHNAFFATKVSFANQMRVIAEAAGADPKGVMDIVTADHRNTTSHLDPMLGPYGGKCLPKDTEALRLFGQQQNASTPLLDGTVWMNALAKDKYDHLDIEGTWPDISVSSD